MTAHLTTERPVSPALIAVKNLSPLGQARARSGDVAWRGTRLIRWSRTTRRPLLANAAVHALIGLPAGYAVGLVVVHPPARLAVGLSLAAIALGLGGYLLWQKHRGGLSLSRSRPAL